MERKLYLIKKVSQKSGKEPFTYVQMYAELEYGKLIVSMDKNAISELLGVSVSMLYSLDVDSPVEVAILTPSKEF